MFRGVRATRGGYLPCATFRVRSAEVSAGPGATGSGIRTTGSVDVPGPRTRDRGQARLLRLRIRLLDNVETVGVPLEQHDDLDADRDGRRHECEKDRHGNVPDPSDPSGRATPRVDDAAKSEHREPERHRHDQPRPYLGPEMKRAGERHRDPDGGQDEREEPVGVQTDEQDARCRRQDVSDRVDVPPQPPSSLLQEVLPRERRRDRHIVPHEPPGHTSERGHMPEDQIFGGEHLVVPRHERLGRSSDAEALSVNMDRMTDPLEHRAHVEAVDRSEIVHMRQEPTVASPWRGDALTHVVVGLEDLFDVALGRQTVVVQEQHLDVEVVQPSLGPQPTRVFERPCLVRRPTLELLGNDDDLVRALIVPRRPRLGRDPDHIRELELIPADPADDRVHGRLVPHGGDLDDQQRRERKERLPAGTASAKGSGGDHPHAQDGGQPCDKDQRRHTITVLARDRCSA